jgi:hypothetical protein
MKKICGLVDSGFDVRSWNLPGMESGGMIGFFI